MLLLELTLVNQHWRESLLSIVVKSNDCKELTDAERNTCQTRREISIGLLLARQG